MSDELDPLSWLCAAVDVTNGYLKVVHQESTTIRVLVKETGQVWEFQAKEIRSAAE